MKSGKYCENNCCDPDEIDPITGLKCFCPVCGGLRVQNLSQSSKAKYNLK